MATLIYDNHVLIDEVDYNYSIMANSDGFFCQVKGKSNSFFLAHFINKDQYEFQEEVLGYTDEDGIFPYCRSLEDIQTFLDAIFREISKSHSVVTKYSDLECWDD